MDIPLRFNRRGENQLNAKQGPIRTTVVDPSSLTGNTMRAWLTKEPNFSIHAVFDSIEQAAVGLGQIDLLVLSSKFDEEKIIQGCLKLQEARPQLKILLIAEEACRAKAERLQQETDCDIWFADSAEDFIQLASSMIGKQAEVQPCNPRLEGQLERLSHLIREMDAGVEMFSKSVNQLHDQLARSHESLQDSQFDKSELTPLTERELEVLHFVEEGKSNPEIADELAIQEGTVKNHVHNILTKYKVSSRHEAARVHRLLGA